MQYRAANAHIEEHAVALVKNIRLLRDNNVQYVRIFLFCCNAAEIIYSE